MSPANTYDPVKVQAQRAAQMGRPENRQRGRGQVAVQLVRGWPPDQRARIRAMLIEFVEAMYARGFVDVLKSGEMEVVKLIDQINEEEQRPAVVSRRCNPTKGQR